MNRLIIYVDISFTDRGHYPVFMDEENNTDIDNCMWNSTNNLLIKKKLHDYINKNNLTELLYITNFGNININFDIEKINGKMCNILEIDDSQGLHDVKIIYDNELENCINECHENLKSIEEASNGEIKANMHMVKKILKNGIILYNIFAEYINTVTNVEEYIGDCYRIYTNVPIL